MRSATRFFVSLALLLAPAWSEAKALHVNATSGNDATTYENNSAASPWRTIGRAAWGSTDCDAPDAAQAARAGDVVHVAAGVYVTTGTNNRYAVAYNPVNSGSAGSPIAFQADGVVTLELSSGAGPVIGACGSGGGCGAARDYITWRGFTINEVNATSVADTGPVVLAGTTGSVIESCVIVGIGNNSRQDNYTGIRVDGGIDITLRNNRISNYRGYGRNAAGIMTYYSGRLLIEHNEISNSGNGIYLKANLDNTDWVTARYNLIFNTEVAGFDIHRQPNTAAAPVRIYQNVVRDTAAAVLIHGFDSGATDARHVLMINNTFVNNTAGLHILYPMVDDAGHMFWNNVVSGGTDGVLVDAPGSNLIPSRARFDFNLYSSPTTANVSSTPYTLATWKSTYGQDANAIDSDPGFVSATDLRLQTTSPARGLGRDYLDLDGDGSTSNAINAGAYIRGTEVIGVGTVTALPRAPTGLRIVGS